MKMNAHYPNLFSPFLAGKRNVEFKHRIFSAPMHAPLFGNPNGVLNEHGLRFYTDKAKGGVACVEVGQVQMDLLASGGHIRALNMASEAALLEYHILNRYAHAFGAKTSFEINHEGHYAFPQKDENGNMVQPMSVCAMTMPNGVEVRAMDEADMDRVAESYANTAAMGKRAGFDMVCLHFGHGWLISAFLSPLTNHRTDQYGGSPENRMRFPKMILERIRAKVGDEMLIEVRMSGSEFTPGGLEIEDTIEYIKMIEPLIDLVHISSGNRMNATSRAEMHPSHFMPIAHMAEMSEQVKLSGVKIPVGVVGGVHDPDVAERIIAEGKADYVLLARQLLADTDWPNKARAGRKEEIRRCLRCNYCMDHGRRKAIADSVLFDSSASFDMACAINPLLGQGYYKATVPAPDRKKKVVVIGGGAAGLEAAAENAKRGHQVILMEKSGSLGGQLFYADHVSFKKEMKLFREYLERQARAAGVDIRMHTEATPESVAAMEPDAVIVAVGADPITLPIPGVNMPHVWQALDLFGHEDKLGKRVVIVGGGLVGCETAIHLGNLGHEVTVLEMGPYLAPQAELSDRLHVLKYMGLAGAQGLTGVRCTGITGSGVQAEDESGEKFFEADNVVLCAGMRERVGLRDRFQDAAPIVISIGDCIDASNLAHAIHSGYDTAVRLSIE